MSPQEYLLLSQPRLSHPARSLYVLSLRRAALQHQPVIANYPELGRFLAVTDPSTPSGFSYQVTGKQLTALFQELIETGLIQVEALSADEQHYHQKSIFLPLIKKTTLPLKQQAFAMMIDWQPDDSFPQICHLCGLIDTTYNSTELGEFVAYWIGQPDKYATQHQWMMKFVKMLKGQRYQKQTIEPVGYQTQALAAETTQGPSPRAIEMMAQAKVISEKGE